MLKSRERIAIRENELSNSRKPINNQWVRILNPRERIAQFEIYLCYFFLKTLMSLQGHVSFQGFRRFWTAGLSGVYRHTREFSLIWRRHHYRWRAANFDLCSALVAIEQCHTYCNTGHPRTCDTLTYCQAFGSEDVTSCFYDFGLSRPGFENPTFCFQGQRSNPLRHRCVPDGWRKCWECILLNPLTKLLPSA